MNTTNALDDQFDEIEKGLEWLEKLEALQARSASDQAAIEVADYVMKLRGAVLALSDDRGISEIGAAVGEEIGQLVAELRYEGDNDRWYSRIRPALLKTDP